MINERLFGAPIPANVRKKLEDRQAVAGNVAPGESIQAVFPDTDGNNQADLSSRTPFVRMWTSMRLIDPAAMFEDPPQAKKITKELLENNEINYSGDIDFEVAQKLINKVKQSSENLLRVKNGQVLKDVIYADPKIVESRKWEDTTPGPSIFFIVGNLSRDQMNYARKTYIIGDVNYQQYYNAVAVNDTLEHETGNILNLQGGADYIKGLPKRRANLINLSGEPVIPGAPQRGKRIILPSGNPSRTLREPSPLNLGLGFNTQNVNVVGATSRAGYAGNADTTAPAGFKQELSYNPFLKPQAGITSVTSETDGSLGVIKKTIVNFKVNNFYDFDDIYNRFFLKPGATVFVDFGWSSINNLYNPQDLLQAYNPDENSNFDSMNDSESTLQSGISSNPLVNMYEKLYYEPDTSNANDLKPEGIITKENGDLEVLQGIVTDYSSKINKDGTVDCSVTLTSSNSALLNSNNDPMITSKITSLLKQGILYFGLIPSIDDVSTSSDGSCEHPNKTVKINNRSVEIYDPNTNPVHKTKKQCTTPGIGGGGYGYWKDNDLKELLSSPDASFSATDELQYNKNVKMLASKILSGRFGPEGNGIRTGVHVDNLNAENTFINWGLFEDLVINSFFGFGADIEKINEGKNFNIRLDSSNSFTSWNKEIQKKQRVLFSVPESPPTAIYPEWWGNGDPDYKGGLAANLTTALRPGSYNFQQNKRPSDYKAKLNQFQTSYDSGNNARAQEYYDIAVKDKTASGVEIDHSEIDKYFNRIPLREIFVSTTLIIKAFNANKSVKKILEDILKDLNDNSDGVFNWKLIVGNSDSEFKVVDMHYLQSNEELKTKMLKENPNSGLLDLLNDDDENHFFRFNIMSENSIVSDYNLEFKLPDNAIGNMYAISGMSHDTSIFPVDEVTEQVTGITSLDEQHNRIIYEPDNGSFRIEQMDKSKNDAVKFNIYQTIQDFTSTDYFTIGAPIVGNAIEGNMTGSNAVSPKEKKIGTNAPEPTPPTVHELIKINDDLMINMNMQVASSFTNYFELINVGNSTHDQRPNLLPYTLTLKTYGIASIQPGDTFTVDYLPVRHLNNTFLQVMKVKHDIASNGWYTELETQYRLLPHKKSTVYKNYSAKSAEKVRLSASVLQRLRFNNGLHIDKNTIAYPLMLIAPTIIDSRLNNEPIGSNINFSITFKTRGKASFDEIKTLKVDGKSGKDLFDKPQSEIRLYNAKQQGALITAGSSVTQISVKFNNNKEMIEICNKEFGDGGWHTVNAGRQPTTKEILEKKCHAIQISSREIALPPVIYYKEGYKLSSNKEDEPYGTLHKYEIIYIDGFMGILDRNVKTYQKTREFFQKFASVDTLKSQSQLGVGLGKVGAMCFLEGTQVTLEDNSMKNIEDIQVDDLVLSYNENTSKLESKQVTKIFHHLKEESGNINDYWIVNNNLKATSNHRMYTNNGIKFLENLKIGDILINKELKNVRIDTIEIVNKKVEKYYNFEVEDNNNYFADSYLVSSV